MAAALPPAFQQQLQQAVAAAVSALRQPSSRPVGSPPLCDLRPTLKAPLPGQFKLQGKYHCVLCGKADNKSNSHHPGTCSTGPLDFTTDAKVRDEAACALAAWKKQFGAANVLTAGPASAAPARQAAAAATAVDNWSDSDNRCNQLDEDDEMNVDCDPYTKSPSCVPSNASRVSSSLPSPHVSSIVDSGCAPCHCAHPSIAHCPVRPSHRMVTTAHAAAHTPVAEFVSASKAADELVWQQRLLDCMGLTQSSPTPLRLYEDNCTCRIMSENPVQTERSKHIDYCVHSLRDCVSAGVVCLLDCASHNMVADSLTKNLPADAFIRHSNSQLGCAPMCVK
jgi:hypothetical protein